VTGSRQWVEAAFELAHQCASPLLLAVEDHTMLVGLLPLALHRSGDVRTLRFAGAPHNDLADVLVLPGREKEVALAIAGALVRLSRRGCSVELEDVDPDGTLARCLPIRRSLAWSDASCAPLVDLHGEWRSAASARRRSQWDRKLRRLHDAHRVEFRRLDGMDVLPRLDDFERIRRARLRSAGRAQDQPPMAFARAVATRLASSNGCALAEMLVDGRPAAADLYLLAHDVALMWLRGLAPGWRRFPCGHLLLRVTAEGLESDGFTVLDLGRGDEPYKYVFGARPRVLGRIAASASGAP
jgi:CelD/BcsL family acetyltransferase involved in cellulose biosynthesis